MHMRKQITMFSIVLFLMKAQSIFWKIFGHAKVFVKNRLIIIGLQTFNHKFQGLEFKKLLITHIEIIFIE